MFLPPHEGINLPNLNNFNFLIFIIINNISF
jgi:hypothetical protein